MVVLTVVVGAGVTFLTVVVVRRTGVLRGAVVCVTCVFEVVVLDVCTDELVVCGGVTFVSVVVVVVVGTVTGGGVTTVAGCGGGGGGVL